MKRYWVLRDLSNGDGADGRPMPTYVWAFTTRQRARELGWQHQAAQHHRIPLLTQLGPVEQWTAHKLHKHYKGGDIGTAGQHYYRRRA